MISTTLDRWYVALTMRQQWKKNSARVLERIQSFEATEDDSAWQLLHAASRLKEPSFKTQLFMQALEETHHAEIFRALYKESAGQPLKKIAVERKPLYTHQAPWKLFVFFAIGEKSAARRFKSIAEQLEPGEFRRSLVKILEEEEGHVEMAGHLAAMTGQTQKAIQSESRKVHLRRASEAWLRVGRHLTSHVSRALLNTTYYIVGGWIRPARRTQITQGTK